MAHSLVVELELSSNTRATTLKIQKQCQLGKWQHNESIEARERGEAYDDKSQCEDDNQDKSSSSNRKTFQTRMFSEDTRLTKKYKNMLTKIFVLIEEMGLM